MVDIKSPLPSREVNLESEVEENNKEAVALNKETETRVNIGNKGDSQKISSIKKPKGIPLGGKMGIVAVVGGIVILIAIIFGIKKLAGNKTGTNGKETVVNYWGLWEDDVVINGLIAKFEEANPNIKINYQKQNKENYRTRLEAKMEKGSDDSPDIFRFHSSWLPMISDRLESVPATISRNLKMDEDFFEVYGKDLKINKNYMGIPLMYDGLVLYYNKDLLDASNKNIPKTWWGLSNTASELTVRDEEGNIKISGVAMGATSNVDHWQDIIGLMMKQNGVDLTNMNEENIVKLRGILDFYRYFGQKQKWDIWSEKLPNSTQLFASGKLVFYFGPSWRMHEINELNPKLNYGTAKVPQLATIEGVDPEKVENGLMEGKLTNISWASYWVEGVWNKSPKKEAAWAFLEFLASEENLSDFYAAASLVRDFGEISPRKSMTQIMSSNPKLATFVENANYSLSGLPSSRTWDDGLNKELSDYFESVLNVATIDEEAETNLLSGIARVVDFYKISK